MKCSLNVHQFKLVESVVQVYSILAGFLPTCPINNIESGLSKSAAIVVDLSISSRSSISFYFMYFEALLLVAYTEDCAF